MLRYWQLVIILCILIVGISISRCDGQSDLSDNIDPDKKKKAIQSAEEWLKLSDNGDFTSCWEMSSAYFKLVIPKDKLNQSMTAVRNPLGKLISRKLKSVKYATSLPGIPDGEYIIIEYNTTFGNKKSAVETIRPSLDKDGQWRVSAYFIR